MLLAKIRTQIRQPSLKWNKLLFTIRKKSQTVLWFIKQWRNIYNTSALQKRGNKNQQCVKNTRFSIKQQKKLSQDWLKAQNDISDNSRQKDTKKEIKKDHCFEQYLKIIRNPAHRISMTKLWLKVHTLCIQTGKYENEGASTK